MNCYIYKLIYKIIIKIFELTIIFMTSVSILTITQYKRFNCLKNLYDIIQEQNYTNIKEWIIVEGSQNIDLKKNNTANIEGFIMLQL